MSIVGAVAILAAPGLASPTVAAVEPSVRETSVSIGTAASGAVVAWRPWGAQLALPPADAQSGVSAVAVNQFTGQSALALKNGAVIAWSNSAVKMLDVPQELKSGVTAIAAGAAFGLAIKDGRVYAWGCEGLAEPVCIVPPDLSSGVSAISAGAGHALALKGGAVYAWGADLEDGTVTAVPDEAKSGVSSIAAGGSYSLAIKDGRVIGWGRDYFGQVSTADTGFTSIAAGNDTSLGLRNGGVFAWGKWGNSSIPLEAQSGVSAIAVGLQLMVALKDGRVLAWDPSTGTEVSVPPALQSEVSAIGISMNDQVVTLRETWPGPGRVSSMKASPISGGVNVTWSPPNGILTPTSLKYRYQVGRPPWRTTKATELRVKAPRGARITVQVRAVNEYGMGPVSSLVVIGR